MPENGEVWPDWPEDLATRIRDWFRRLLLYFLHLIDGTNYTPDSPPNTRPEESELLTQDFEIAEVDNVDDSITEVPEAGMKDPIFVDIRTQPNIPFSFIPDQKSIPPRNW